MLMLLVGPDNVTALEKLMLIKNFWSVFYWNFLRSDDNGFNFHWNTVRHSYVCVSLVKPSVGMRWS